MNRASQVIMGPVDSEASSQWAIVNPEHAYQVPESKVVRRWRPLNIAKRKINSSKLIQLLA